MPNSLELNVSPALLHTFANHPFHVRKDMEMNELVDSIRENGVLTNLTVRRRAEGGNKIHVFTTEIPRNVKVQESQANAEPTILYDPKSNSAKAYIEFAKEVSGYGREEQVFERDEDALNR